MKFIDTFEHHRQHPEITASEHIDNLRYELGISLEGKTLIYLDTKYWVLLRDVVLGRTVETEIKQIYEHLTQLTTKGIVLCPFSEDIFHEIIKQSDQITLEASLNLIDKFSSGVSIRSLEDRLKIEMLHLLERYNEDSNTPKLESLIWTKLANALGRLMIPTDTAFNKEDELVMQKTFTDQLWSISLIELYGFIGFEKLQKEFPHYPDFSSYMNEDYENHKDDFQSFHEVFMSEIGIKIKGILPEIEDVMATAYHRETGNILSEEEKKDTRIIQNIIYNSFKYKKEGDNFRSINVSCGLHAAIWWNEKQKYKKNDFYDIGHAQAAIPYCDYFFTEKYIKHVVTTEPLKYDKKFKCKVLANPKEVLEVLKSLNRH